MLTMKAKYALRALCTLARRDREPLAARVLAEDARIPEKFLETILVELRNAGFVVGQLRDHRAGLFLARQLTTIACDMPLAVDSRALKRRSPDLAALNELYDTVGFGRLLRNQAERILERWG